jgi:enamine deaminase RidA (YjgF/YER057c/UK114 family)
MNSLNPAGWPRPKGYANAVVAKGREIFVSGMVGWDAQSVFHTDDFAGQAAQAEQPPTFQSLLEALAAPTLGFVRTTSSRPARAPSAEACSVASPCARVRRATGP